MDRLQHLPASLQRAGSVKRPFDHARDPYVSAQLKDMAKTEAQRRKSSGHGSSMIRLHRPFPELRPKIETQPLRQSFNRAWLKEQRAAVLARFEQQRQHKDTGHDHDQSQDRMQPLRQYTR